MGTSHLKLNLKSCCTDRNLKTLENMRYLDETGKQETSFRGANELKCRHNL